MLCAVAQAGCACRSRSLSAPWALGHSAIEVIIEKARETLIRRLAVHKPEHGAQGDDPLDVVHLSISPPISAAFIMSSYQACERLKPATCMSCHIPVL